MGGIFFVQNSHGMEDWATLDSFHHFHGHSDMCICLALLFLYKRLLLHKN